MEKSSKTDQLQKESPTPTDADPEPPDRLKTKRTQTI